MPRSTQSCTATDEQREGLQAFADARGLALPDLDAPDLDDRLTVKTTITRAEARKLGKLAFELDTHASNIMRGLIRQMLKGV